jgi:hypothetical protein
MTTTVLAYSPGFALAGLLFLAAALCGRLERWHTRREAAIAEYRARPHSARVGTARHGRDVIEGDPTA